ncbi:MAG: hypothetical protein ABIJ97_14105 [Bacteroidota bacterium]
MTHLKKYLILLFAAMQINYFVAQNIAITDDDAYTANSSAMLDVKSLTKGLLIPRLTTAQRTAIVSPTNSLLVFDTNFSAFFYWTGTSWTKIGTSNSDYWLPDGNNIYFNAGNVGVGTSSPGRKMIVKGSSVNLNEAIFAVQNTDGDTVFAVYPEGVRVWVNDDGGSKASGNRGGFAVGGFSPSKAGFTNEYLRVTPDSVRVYINDDFIGSKASGNRGGFAVGGYNPSKGTPTDHYLFVQDDSTRIWTDGNGGFEVRDITSSNTNYLDLNPENYFIGHNCGTNSTGNYNIFIGYGAGSDNTSGEYGLFMGYNAGAWNTTGSRNTFIGFQSGWQNISGAFNTFLGTHSGRSNNSGISNVFLGEGTGYSNLAGNYNVYVGSGAGYNANSSDNIFIGLNAGYNSTGNSNVFIGSQAGYNETGSGKLYIDNTNTSTPLIYGDFTSNYLYINGNFKATGILYDSGGDAGIAGQILSSTATGTNWISAPTSLTGSGTATQLAYWSGGSSLTSSSNLYWDASNSRLGIGTTSPTEALHVNGGIRLGFNTNSIAGTMQWTGADFLGFNGSTWVSLTAQGTVTGSGTATQVAFWNSATSLSSNGNLYWNNGSAYLGVGTASPSYRIHSVNSLTFNDDPAVYGTHSATDNYGVGVRGDGRWRGVQGYSYSGSGSATGVYAEASLSGTATGYGIYATISNSGIGTAYAGYFQGNVHVNGTLSKSAGTFRIDHPQDPENKYLIHSFVESPDMKNVYDGIAICDNYGKAVVILPGYFESLNKDFRYQLTTLGEYAPVYIEQEIQKGQFVIAGGNPGMKVSLQITGIRKDPFAIQNPIIVEQEKNISEKGLYLNPELYNKSENKSIYRSNEK